MTGRAVFLDRDGVLIRDRDLLTRADEVELFDCAPTAIERLRAAGFAVVVVSNQPVIARGLATEAEVEAVNERIRALLRERAAAELDAVYFCPHHPNATLELYRAACDCRKPGSGMLLRARDELHLDLDGSFMVGDRPSDVEAGRRAGCRTILVRTGKHDAPPIETAAPVEYGAPDHVCADLAEAVDYILASAG